jgi:hypothetical protein
MYLLLVGTFNVCVDITMDPEVLQSIMSGIVFRKPVLSSYLQSESNKRTPN